MNTSDQPAEVNSGARQLLVFCDGTNNTLNGGVGDTNVLKLAQGLRTHNANDVGQLVWYDPGVGAAVNLPEATLWSQFKGYLARLWGLAFGDGVFENMVQAITFLARNYQADDQIYLFGFSRGAFTARAVAGVINQYGLPQPDQLHLLPILIERYFSSGNAGMRRDHTTLVQARTMTGARRLFIHFVGVWDTVDEVGLPIPLFSRRIRNGNGLADKCFLHVRHVLALDEHRRQFRPRLYQCDVGSHTARVDGHKCEGTHKQVALPGCHSDIGGGYQESGLSDLSLAWMVEEARACGLRLGSYRPPSGATPADIRVHSELQTGVLWALLGQCARREGGSLSPLLPPSGWSGQVPVGEKPLPSVWQRGRIARILIWMLALGVTLLAWQGLGEIPGGSSIPQWQLLVGFGHGGELPAEPLHVIRHLLVDMGFISGLALCLCLAGSAGFARLAGQRRAGELVPRWLTFLGMALPVYLVADLSENLLTALYMWEAPGTGFWICLTALCLSVAAWIKCLAFLGAAALGLFGLWAEGSAWVRRRT
ncbi:DUF2235 domain-containing protein [Hydrogenophaga sp. MI9]|uniref:DUF2235 domain-containing protein n=1 Tax=Hydrogenophaga sp. MI9 TaxID=3453719 RepID=UPI003EEBB282